MPDQNQPDPNKNSSQPIDKPAGSAPPIIFPQSDLPPLPPAFSTINETGPAEQSTPKSDVPATPTLSQVTNPPADINIGSGAPPDISSVIPKAKKKFGGGKIIATILGLVVLVGGVGAGILLTQQPQLFQQKAGTGPYSAACGDQTTGCKYYDCSQRINCTNGQLELGFCRTGYPPAGSVDPCGRDSNNGGSTDCVGSGYACTGSGQGNCCNGNTCTPTGRSSPANQCVPDNSVGGNPPTTGNSIPACTFSNSEICVGNNRDENCYYKTVTGIKYSCYKLKGNPGRKINDDLNNNCSCSLAGYNWGPIYENGGWWCFNTSTVCNGVDPYAERCLTTDLGCGEISTPANPPEPPITPTPTPTTGAPSCIGPIKAYDDTWTALTDTQLSTLTVGDVVNFCISGSTNGTYDKAQFMINTILETETTTKRAGSDDFCQSYTILSTDTTINVKAKIHDTVSGWVGETI
jgi:hypothetical protein